ncbi:amino acid permease/ SLC12A domain-containing protein [Phakopsora pachyrhizi]|nr:amino acid permease/ SLC12A domain-containing protein [Phakopsora pachyrhizi]
MISMGGVIGLGLFLVSANILRESGPLGLLLGYAVMATLIWSVMSSLGEMISFLPLPGGHVTLANRFVSPSFSFALGWCYWYEWSIILAAELSASAIIMGYWKTSLSSGVIISCILAFVSAINFMPTRFFGEFEFWFASIKIVTVVALIILGIVIDLGGGPNKEFIGFRYWKDPGPFVQFLGIPGAAGRFLGFWSSLIQAAFSCIGTEITAITAGETKNPKKTLPSAIKKVVIRIFVFYIFGTLIIGLIVSSSDPHLNLQSHDAASSPFVIAIQNSGIKVLPSIVNAALLTTACSAASSDTYTSSRAMHALALAGNAPAFMKTTNRWGVPYLCVMLTTAMGTLSFMTLGGSGPGKVFGYIANMSSTAGLITWVGIAITYLRWDAGVKAQMIDRSKFPYRSVLRSKAAMYALIMCSAILIFNPFVIFFPGNWSTPTLLVAYLPLVSFAALYYSRKLYYSYIGVDSKVIPLNEIVRGFIKFFMRFNTFTIFFSFF